MSNIGTVTVGNNTQKNIRVNVPESTIVNGTNNQLNKIGNIKLQQQIQTSILSPAHTPNTGISNLRDLQDVNDSSLGNDYILVYDAVTETYVTKPMANVSVSVSEIAGGTF